jgi:hypothetical protein
MFPYDTPSTIFDNHFGPSTALTPKIVAHGGGNNLRVLKGNPVGYVQHPGGQFRPYLSARMEHAHQPVEAAMIEHAKLGTIAIDHYHLGTVVPARHAGPVRQVSPSSQYQWPDTSVSASIVTDLFGDGSHPGPQFGKGVKYGPLEGSVNKP